MSAAPPKSSAASPTIEETAELLASGDFDQFITRTEGEFFEAKGAAPYDLSTALGRYELAKDVSAFANSQGGYLLVGLTSKILDSENTEEVTALDLLKESAFLIKQFEGILKGHIWPEILGMKVGWRGSKQDPSLGVGFVYVPPQSEDRKFFLITKVVEDGVPLKEIVFGIARRVKASNLPVTPQELGRYIREGRNSFAQRLTRIEEKLDSALSPRPAKIETPAAEKLATRLKDMRSS